MGIGGSGLFYVVLSLLFLWVSWIYRHNKHIWAKRTDRRGKTGLGFMKPNIHKCTLLVRETGIFEEGFFFLHPAEL